MGGEEAKEDEEVMKQLAEDEMGQQHMLLKQPWKKRGMRRK